MLGISRGVTVCINAVLWFSDLRGSKTARSSRARDRKQQAPR
jgi:hypothetical protein